MKNVISIDFGTSNSTVCWTNPKTGQPEVIKDRNGSEKIPSVVYWGAGKEVLVGEAAIARLTDAQHDETESRDAMQRVVKSVKRALRHNQPHALPDGRMIMPLDTVARILGYLKELAEKTAFHEPVDSVVLTHPVMMTQREKELLNQAAKKAGFATVLFKEEPVAAALGYLASGAKVGDGILVFDLGGGTLDLAYLQKAADGSYRIPVECMGDAECGGDDYDQIIYDHWEAQMQAQYKRGFAEKNGEISPFVILECRKAKEKLSEMQTARMSFYFKKDGHHEQAAFALTRKEFEAMAKGFAEKSVQKTRQMLQRVAEAGQKVDTVLLIGGATRMPILREALKAVLPVQPTETMYADVAVALGGAPKVQLISASEPTPTTSSIPKQPEPRPFRRFMLIMLFTLLAGLTIGGVVRFVKYQEEMAEQRQRQYEAARQAEAERKASLHAPPLGKDFTVPVCEIDMVWIPEGRFIMGSPSREVSYVFDDETQHLVTLSLGYWIGKLEITQAQWFDVMGFNCSQQGHGRNYPADSMTWAEAMEFCKTLTTRERAAGRLPTGYEYSLPTEAQWEYACRAGTTGPYSGSGNLDSMGWFDGNSGNTPHPVGGKQANAWGLFDMHGNVWEWCLDTRRTEDYHSRDEVHSSRYDYSERECIDPVSLAGPYRILRGGSWSSDAANCRSANRFHCEPGSRINNLGFRIALRHVQ